MLLRKPPATLTEIYNDLDGDVVNLFRVLRDPVPAARLIETLALTPFARAEFDAAYESPADPVEQARRLVIRSYMGFGSDSAIAGNNTGFRVQSPGSNRSPELDWSNYPEKLSAVVARLREVVIESRPALEVMQRFDSPATLHYVDPPYLPETRSAKSRKSGGKYHAYAHELTSEDHVELLEALRGLEGMVILSGYPSELYDGRLSDWMRIERAALADGARPRVEVLWLNAAAVDAWRGQGLFAA